MEPWTYTDGDNGELVISTCNPGEVTVQIAAGGYYEFPQPIFLGQVDGIWASANGNARLTSW